ncbi:MAG: antibiotic biosynthesis monooxygenase [Bacteroidota bacterium]
MTPQTPYYAVIFTSLRTDKDLGYHQMAQKMEALAQQQPGYLGIESARSEMGITVSYWESLEAIALWKAQIDHQAAQQKGRDQWYAWYRVRICKVERQYEFNNL